jgi:hypothetical protein
VFNGDFADRGGQQVEVVALLFSLKVCFPDCVFLLRGNREFRDMNTSSLSRAMRGLFELAPFFSVLKLGFVFSKAFIGAARLCPKTNLPLLQYSD